MQKKPLSKSSNSTPGLSAATSSSSKAERSRPQPDHSFPAALRIKKRDEFARVFDCGQVAADGVLVIHAVRQPNSPIRMGISVSKKVGCAPQRNRWKRLIREAFRIHHHELPGELLIVVRPKRGAVPDFHAIERSIVTLVDRLNRKL